MCFMKMKTPKVPEPQVTASQLVPETTADTPESAKMGGEDDLTAKRKGAKALRIPLASSYRPTNY